MILPNNAHLLSELIHSDTHMLVSTKTCANGLDTNDKEKMTVVKYSSLLWDFWLATTFLDGFFVSSVSHCHYSMVHCFSVAHFLENKGTGKKEKDQCLGAISVLSHTGHSCNPLFSCFYLFGWFPSSYCCTKMSPLVLNFCFNVRITCRLVSEKSFHKVDTVKHKNMCCRTCAEKKPPHWRKWNRGLNGTNKMLTDTMNASAM